MIRLHNQNRTHAFIDVESGQFISLPKDETDKPPVNADVNGLMIYGKTTQDGEPSPDNLVDLVSIPPEFNLTVCGKNLFNHRNNAIANGSIEIIDDYVRCTGNNADANDFAFARGWYRPNNYLAEEYNQPILKSGDVVTISADVRLIEQRNTPSIRIYLYSNSNSAGHISNQAKSLMLNTWVRVSQSCTITSTSLVGKDDYYPIFALNSNIVDIKNIAIKYGTDDTYTPYTGNTYPYRLEDLDGNLHELCSLPDGTADTYNRETGELTKRTKSIVLDGSESGWHLYTADALDDYIRFANNVVITDDYKYPLNDNGVGGNYISSHFLPGRAWDASTFNNLFALANPGGSNIYIKIAKSELTGYSVGLTDAQKVDLFKTWLGSNNVTVQYKLATPQTVQIKQYGKTYNGQVWLHNQKPKSIQYHTNIFTDVGAEMQCEVRKLGNRAMGTFNWVTENGDKIITEDEDYIMFEY